MVYTIKLENVNKKSIDVGVKAANLGELINNRFPVPPGFIVTKEAFEKFLKVNKIESKVRDLISDIDFDNLQSLREVTGQIESLIMGTEMPEFIRKDIKEEYEELSVGKEAREVGGVALDMIKAGRGQEFVAVRSSPNIENPAVTSFAGQTESFLNVRGTEQLFDAIKKCWASFFSINAMFYRRVKGDNTQGINVIVQKMVNADKAGVIFTANPANIDTSKFVIESSFGLGESVTSGLITPDSYVIDKDTGNILEKKISKKLWLKTRDALSGKTVKERVSTSKMDAEVLDGDSIKKLCELARNVESYYNGQPQDIEWCEERNRIFLVQTRPITTQRVNDIDQQTVTPDDKKVLFSGLSVSPGVSRGKARIVLDLNDFSKVEHGDIVVTKSASSDMTLLMKRAAAVVSDEGGYASSVIAREFGVPCITGTGTATSDLNDEQEIIVDALNGNVYQETSSEPDAGIIPREGITQNNIEKMPGLYENVTGTEIKINLSFPNVDSDIAKQADGVGLLKAEHMLTESRRHPFLLAISDPNQLIETIFNSVGKVAKIFYPKHVWYRTLNLRTDELRQLEGGGEEPVEANPLIGWHGIRRSLDQPEIFNCELQAMKRLYQEGLNNIQ